MANRPAAVPRWETMKQSRQTWDSLGNYYLCRAWRFMKISWKSAHLFFHNITIKHGSRKQKKLALDYKGLTAISRKCTSLFLVPRSNFPENFMKILSCVMLLTDTDFLADAEKETQYPRGKTWHPLNFQDCSLYHARPILKISWKSVNVFFP